jgi:hypothetical protein
MAALLRKSVDVRGSLEWVLAIFATILGIQHRDLLALGAFQLEIRTCDGKR